MTHPNCINNRNIKIIATYVKGKLGSWDPLFEGLSYPTEEYPSAEDFFLDEDQWTTYENFDLVLRKAKTLANEPDFCFNCGISSAKLHSWGRFQYFLKVFATPNDGYIRVPFFNKNLNDTKDIEVVSPPVFDRNTKKIRTLLKAKFHEDFDLNRDYMAAPYLRGILSSIPTLWGLPPARVKETLSPYDPEVVFNRDPEFAPYHLDVAVKDGVMTLRHPVTGERAKVGKRVFLVADQINDHPVFMGKYSANPAEALSNTPNPQEAILITQTIQVDGQTLFREGELFKGPYAILDITYDRISCLQRIAPLFSVGGLQDSGEELIETLDQLRKNVMAKNEAYLVLEKSNEELKEAKARLDQYNTELENKVEERTFELRKAQEELLQLNAELEAKVQTQVRQLERYKELRRYLSPKLAEQILSSDQGLGTEPERKLVTVIFTDIRGFSNLTDSIEPEEAFSVLNHYLAEMIKIVHDHDGTLNKITGDGLLIFFGDPVPVSDHAERAVRMAAAMQQRVDQLKEDWTQYGQDMGVGIGINTGFVTVGNVGSEIHRDYTIVGTQVNVAARLESLALAGQILISKRTHSKVHHLVRTDDVGEIQVKGIPRPVKVYSVLW